MLTGVAITADPEAVVVIADRPWQVVSSAAVGGGVGHARSIVNLHVPHDFVHATLHARVSALARRRGLPAPCVGLATAASTAEARIASESAGGITVVAAVTVGLSNPVTAGVTAMGSAAVSTINTIVLVDADPKTAALVNAVVTATEVKTSVLHAAGVRCSDGEPATGTSTDAVVVAASGRGRACAFGGPLSDLGWVVARAVRSATADGVRLWLEQKA
jgi:adenosylcobinamide hydrolase